MKKSAQVVMLPTNEKAEIGFLTQKGKERGHLVHFDRPMPIILDSENQHLYFLSDEEIKEGDWFVGFADGSISPFVKQADESTVEINDWQLNKKGTSSNKKIIATTDKSIILPERFPSFTYLPQPSQSFLEKFVEEYNKGNVITEVMVEYEWNKTGRKIRKLDVFDHILKINPDNTIDINMPKDSWSREEMLNLLESAWNGGALYGSSKPNSHYFDKWIEENL